MGEKCKELRPQNRHRFYYKRRLDILAQCSQTCHEGDRAARQQRILFFLG